MKLNMNESLAAIQHGIISASSIATNVLKANIFPSDVLACALPFSQVHQVLEPTRSCVNNRIFASHTAVLASWRNTISWVALHT